MNHVLYGVQIPKIFGVAQTIQKHWQSSLQRLLQRRCRVRCKRDHSIANNAMQQKGSFNMSGKRR